MLEEQSEEEETQEQEEVTCDESEENEAKTCASLSFPQLIHDIDGLDREVGGHIVGR